MMSDMLSSESDGSEPLRGKRVALFGRFAGMTRRDLTKWLRGQGAVVSEKPHPAVELMGVGEGGLPLLDSAEFDEDLDPETCERIRRGAIEVLAETELWRRLGLVEADPGVRQFYTPAMLAELLGVPVAVVRRWHRRGLIRPVREAHRLPYFDFREVAAARRLAELLAAGVSPRAIERKLEALRGLLPGIERPLAQLSVIIEGRQILLRQGDGLIEPGGQLRFDFDATDTPRPAVVGDSQEAPMLADKAHSGDDDMLIQSPQRLAVLAAELEEAGQLAQAAETYRAAMAAGGPTAEWCFHLAEILYRLGDTSAARERYYMAIELDEDYLEARANLGCVLAESAQFDLAAAALEGALTSDPDYPDAHYHLARILDRLGRADEARDHWRAFLRLAPDSPWAHQAREQLGDG